MGCAAIGKPFLVAEPTVAKRKLSKHSSIDLNNPNEVYIALEDFSALYTVSTQIAKGKFGSVYLATSKLNGQQVAIKIQNRENEHSILSELSILSLLNHPNIIKPIEYFQDQKFYYIVFEYISGGELITKNEQVFPENYTKDVIFKLLSAASHMHSQKVVHRDLKPENILVDSEGDIRIIDFGLSKKFLPGVQMSEVVGTPLYMAPEVTNSNYGPECDLWSIGIIMYRMLFGVTPDFGSGKVEIIKKLRSGKLGLKKTKNGTNSEAEQLLNKLLDQNPKKRITVQEALSHTWFKNDKKGGSIPESLIEKVKNRSRPGKLEYFILETGLMLLKSEELDEAKALFRELDRQNLGVVKMYFGGGIQILGYSEFLIQVLLDKIVENTVPMIYNSCLVNGKFSVYSLKKMVCRRGIFVSAAQFNKEFGCLEDFQKYLTAN